MTSSTVVSPDIHLIPTAAGTLAFAPLTLRAVRLDPDEVAAISSETPDLNLADALRQALRLEVSPEELREAAYAGSGAGRIGTYRIVLTEGCNYACRYCFVAEATSRPNVMSRDMLQSVLESIVALSSNQWVSIHWFGGEPLLRWQEIAFGVRKLSDAIRRGQLKGCSHSMTTHGGLITAEIAEALAAADFNIAVSIDGPRELNDLNRIDRRARSTYSGATRGFRLLSEAGLRPGFLLTPHPSTLGHLSESVAFLVEVEGAQRIGINSPQPTAEGWNIDGELFAEHLDVITEYCRSKRVELTSPGSRILGGLSTRQPCVHPCRGTISQMAVSIDTLGRMSNCIVSWSDSTLHGGNRPLTRDAALKAASWKQGVQRTSDCEGCIAEMVCGGWCPLESHLLESHLQNKPREKCRFYRTFTRLSLARLGDGA